MARRDLASRLTELVRIEVRDQQPNGEGGRRSTPGTTGWKEMDEVWAEVIALRGDEAMRHSVERSIQIWKVTIRERDDVNTTLRLVWLKNGTVMDIKSAAPDAQDDRALVMTCESGATGAVRR